MAGFAGDATALVDWIRASQPEGVQVSEGRKYRIVPPSRLKRDDLRLIEPIPAQQKSASMDDGSSPALQASRAFEEDDAATLRKALSMEMAAGRTRVSWAAMAIGRDIETAAKGDREQLKRALFYYELGLWLADNTQQPGEATDGEIALRRDVVDRVRELVRLLPPQDIIAIYRAARDWRVGESLAKWNER